MKTRKRWAKGLCMLIIGLSLIGWSPLNIYKAGAVSYELVDDEQRLVELVDYLSSSGYHSAKPKQLQFDLVQPWLYAWSDKSKIIEDFRFIKNAGFAGVIVQNTVRVDGGSSISDPIIISEVYYNSNLDIYKTNHTRTYANVIDNIMDAADEVGLKIYIGGVHNDGWWTIDNNANSEWMTNNALFASMVYDELYSQYGSREAFMGWYWTPEMYTNNYGLEQYWSEKINITFDLLEIKGIRYPMIAGSFISSWLVATPENVQASWIQFMENTNFKDKDIFILQDGLAMAQYPVPTIVEYIKSFRNAVDYKKESVDIQFNLITENYGFHVSGIGPVERFIEQIKISSQFADNLYCFSYIHYYTPYNKDRLGNYNDESYDLEYRTFIGLTTTDTPEPPENEEVVDNNYHISLNNYPIEGGSVALISNHNHTEDEVIIAKGDIVIVTATANPGYEFVHWSENDEVVSTEAEYAFTASTDRNLCAVFEDLQVSSLPAPPVLLSPKDNTNVSSRAINFQWDISEEALGYRIQVVRFTDGEIFIEQDFGKITSFNAKHFPRDGTEYAWRVKAWNNEGWGEFSDYSYFISLNR